MCILFVSSLSNNNLIREKVLNRNISSVVSFSNRIFQNDFNSDIVSEFDPKGAQR